MKKLSSQKPIYQTVFDNDLEYQKELEYLCQQAEKNYPLTNELPEPEEQNLQDYYQKLAEVLRDE